MDLSNQIGLVDLVDHIDLLDRLGLDYLIVQFYRKRLGNLSFQQNRLDLVGLDFPSYLNYLVDLLDRLDLVHLDNLVDLLDLVVCRIYLLDLVYLGHPFHLEYQLRRMRLFFHSDRLNRLDLLDHLDLVHLVHRLDRLDLERQLHRRRLHYQT